MARPIKIPEFHYPMIQFFIIPTIADSGFFFMRAEITCGVNEKQVFL